MQVGDRIISAADFQEATKDAHVASAMTARMMALVAADVRAWLDMGIPFRHVGINVSSPDIEGGILDQLLAAAFAKEGVPLHHVILEVTETVYMAEGGRLVQRAVEALRANGLRVALDDFGTGYASLTHLLTMPVDIVKIDKSFIARLREGDASAAIVEGLVQIAEKLGIGIIAEGIETEEQARQLFGVGCSLGQGFLYSAAVEREAATELMLGRGSGPARTLAATRAK